MKSALILVDIQNDFMPGGALPVPDGDAVVAVANRVMKEYKLVVATQDWHPADHGSFASCHKDRKVGEVINLAGLQQILWPDHCVQHSAGAGFVAGLSVGNIAKVFRKGTDRTVDSYSGFFDNGHRNSTGLGAYLEEMGVGEVTIVGLATDYCVKFTALDARQLGFQVKVLVEGIRGVDVRSGDSAKAIVEMKQAGVIPV